jgi:hypothetical protein
MGQRQKILGSAGGTGIASCARRRARDQHPAPRSGRADDGAQGFAGQECLRHQAHANPHFPGAGEFDLSGAKIHAVRSVHLKLLREVFDSLSGTALKAEMAQLNAALHQKGLKLGVKKAYSETFERLRAVFRRVQGLCTEIQSMLAATFASSMANTGFRCRRPAEPAIDNAICRTSTGGTRPCAVPGC